MLLTSLAVLLTAGLAANKLVEKFQLPGLIGMLVIGALLGPHGLNVLHEDLLHISQDLRALALIVILLRAGLGIQRSTLNRVGWPALRLSSIPCVLEGLSAALAASLLLQLPAAEAGMLGFILAAVSPAVIVPAMLRLKEKRLGEDKDVPTMVLAGASVDDVVAITLFTAFLGWSLTGDASLWAEFLRFPLRIIGGIGGGLLLGVLLLWVYRSQRFVMRNTEKLLLLLTVSIAYYAVGEQVGVASLLGVMTIGFLILEYREATARRFSHKLNRIWVFAEILLFGLIGAAVNIPIAQQAGLVGLAIIGIGLTARSLGVLLATVRTGLNSGERAFCVIAYLPKATVQAAIGAIPMTMGFASGEVILAIAVLAIVVTAPIGAVGIQWSAPKLLAPPPPD